MIHGKANTRRRWNRLASLILGGIFIIGFLESCNDQLLELTKFVDPCGTFLANCDPGDFQVNASGPGDFCIDPACTVPGQCAGEGQPLGTIFDLCP